LYKLPEVRI